MERKEHYFLSNAISMDSFEVIPDHHIRIIGKKEEKVTHEQVEKFWKAHLANLLIFRHAVLDKQYDLQCKLTQDYLTCLKAGDSVEIGLFGTNSNGQWHGTVIFNDSKIIKIKYSSCDDKVELKTFSTTDGFSEWPVGGNTDEEDGWYYIKTPDIHPIESTQGLLYSEVRDEIKELYNQDIDTKTSYALVNALKYGYLKRS